MKNYRDSDYALNKYSDGIVYRFADTTVVVTPADFLVENPDKTVEDFNVLKDYSDTDYLNQVRHENASTKKNVPIEELVETMAFAVPSVEFDVIDEPDEFERLEARRNLANCALDKLTEIQRKRYIMYHAEGLSTYKIAEVEGKDHKTIFESLKAADKKIKSFLSGE
jgi:DNA-directed RNA polymerase specialized sigma subunit, sigma24 homolog